MATSCLSFDDSNLCRSWHASPFDKTERLPLFNELPSSMSATPTFPCGSPHGPNVIALGEPPKAQKKHVCPGRYHSLPARLHKEWPRDRFVALLESCSLGQ